MLVWAIRCDSCNGFIPSSVSMPINFVIFEGLRDARKTGHRETGRNERVEFFFHYRTTKISPLSKSSWLSFDTCIDLPFSWFSLLRMLCVPQFVAT